MMSFFETATAYFSLIAALKKATPEEQRPKLGVPRGWALRRIEEMAQAERRQATYREEIEKLGLTNARLTMALFSSGTHTGRIEGAPNFELVEREPAIPGGAVPLGVVERGRAYVFGTLDYFDDNRPTAGENGAESTDAQALSWTRCDDDWIVS